MRSNCSLPSATTSHSSIVNAHVSIETEPSDVPQLQNALNLTLDKVVNHPERLEDKSKTISPPLLHQMLPTEIIQYVFQLCTTPDDNIVHIPIVRRHSLTAITRVCSAWRTLALNTPELWSNIWLQFSHHGNRNHLRIHAARTILSRTTRCGDDDEHGSGRTCPPRSLKISNSAFVCNLDPDGLKSIYNLIASYSFYKLDLSFQLLDQVQPLWELANEAWSNLEELRVTCSYLQAEGWPALFSAGVSFRNLKLLEVAVGSWDGLHPQAVVPWHQLRHLDLWPAMPVDTSLHVLSQGKMLEYCAIRIAARGEGSVTPTTSTQQQDTITLPNLTFIKLIFENGTDAKSFIQPFILPNLTTLEIFTRGQPLNCNAMTYSDLAWRSGRMKRMSKLRIGDSESELDVGVLLRSMPTLDHLSLIKPAVDDETVEGLSSGRLGRRLQIVSWKGELDPHRMLRMVELRQENVYRLEEEEGEKEKGKGEGTSRFQVACFICQGTELGNLDVYEARMKAIRERWKHPDLPNMREEESERIPPHEKLPPELMQIIFRLCTVVNDNMVHIPAFRQHAINTIPHVCSAWRALALNTSDLWSCIWLHSSPGSVNQVRAQTTQIILSRAMGHHDGDGDGNGHSHHPPLALKVLPGSPQWEDLKPFCDLIVSYPFQRLDLNLHKSDHIQLLWSLPSEVWLNVEELRLTYYNTPSGQGRVPNWPPLFSSGMVFKSLRSLEVPVGNWNGVHPGAMIPWHQLQCLNLWSAMPMSVYLDILHQCALLEHCVIRIAPTTATTWTRHLQGTITLAHLSFLVINFLDGTDAKSFIQCLNLPNLGALRIYAGRGTTLNFNETTLVEMAQRSGGMKGLSSLRIGDTASELDVQLLLKSMPALAHVLLGRRQWDFVRD
ncbi:hypothetical protein AX17_002815 [Amanita inopinata Kibby_2008]|nr:hypothetical protein AX17_002815 [Amanita inopinata Kibby_2008]